MTREELKEHCLKEIKMCEIWTRLKGEETHRKLYEEHNLILELLEHEQRWIPVSERLPKNRGFYLVSTTDCITIMEFVNGWISQNIGLCNGYVKAWMPLPKAYESQEKENK